MRELVRAMAILALLWMPLASFGGTTPAGADPASVLVLPGRPVAREAELAGGLYLHGGLLWSDRRRLTPQALKLIDIIRASDDFGLRPEDYGIGVISSRVRQLQTGSASDADWQEFDHCLSVAAIRLLIHLHYGRIDPKAAGFDLPVRAPDLDVAAVVAALARAADPAAAVSAVEPKFYHYMLLKRALARYRVLAARPGLTRLPAPGRKAARAGDDYADASALRALLLALGDLLPGEIPAEAQGAEPKLDGYLITAIKRFQQRHGLTQDGALGPLTFAALTTPMAARVRQIELTLERWRWLPALHTPPIIVNIPQFQLFAFHTTEDRVADIQQMPVIVGKSYPRTRTPVFVGSLRYVIFHPYWDVPRQITLHELLPKWRADPDYLSRNHFEIVRGQQVVAAPRLTPTVLAALTSGELRMRQQPGDDNSLGEIKFMLPNAHDIYLHGTPARQLFAQSRRAFSHGCIRVADPAALAAYVLRNAPGQWNARKIADTLQRKRTVRVNLTQPIPVMILYGTVLATEAGPVQFFDDLYGNDRRLAKLLWPATRT